MAGVSDKQVPRQAGWPAGLDNLSPEEALTRDDQGKAIIALREIENADLASGGKPRRREGRTRVLSASRVHSLWRDECQLLPFALYVAGSELRAFQPGGGFVVSNVLSQGLPVSYALAGDRVFWSNGRERGVVLANGDAAPWGCPQPDGEPRVTPVAGMGGLAKGVYQVAITWQLVTGEESGASLAMVADVPEGGGLQLDAFPVPPADVARVRIYVSSAGGDVLYHAQDMAPSLPVLVVGAGRRGRPLDTQFLETMPAGHIVRWLNARLVVATGTELVWSESLRYGLTDRAQNSLSLGQRVSMLEAVDAGGSGSGFYASAGKGTYWLGGADPSVWSQKRVYPYGAVPGTGLIVPGSMFGLETTDPVAYWLASNGVACLGLPGGTVLPLREKQAVSPDAVSGASLFRERNKVRQVITSLQQSRPRGMQMGDRAVVTIERYDA